ncbi:MAG: Serine/threonine-protein kinase PknB [Pseudomonadota bacterium]|jgi:tRNA A-37 threonylcarbamoyl transferase component Bud32
MRKFFNRFGWLALGWIAGSEAKGAVKAVQNHLADPTKALPLAIEQATDKTWQAFELALNTTKLAELKKLIASGTMQAALQGVMRYLEQQGSGFQQKCLLQLQVIQKDVSCRIDLAQSTENLQSFHQPQNLLNEAQQILKENIDELQKDYPELASLLKWQTSPQDLPLFLTLFAYFLRLEVLNHPLLSRLLDLRQPLDLQTAMQQMRGHDSVQQLAEQQQSVLNRANASSGVIQRGLSCSLHSDSERILLKELLKQYRSLPTLQQVKFSSLLNGLGKLAVATGDFTAAQEYFEEAASNLYDQPARAEVLYNKYCSALEQKEWTLALEALQQAVALDKARFEPFLFKRYEIKRILGAGGFGTAFLCQDTFLDQWVVIKTLQSEELNRDVKEIFREAHLLRKLNHVSTVTLLDCNFADAEKGIRPYLVMEYVDAVSLDDFLTKSEKPLSMAQGRQLAMQLAETLLAAHQQGILHRDVKPANVLVHIQGEQLSVKLIDFGLGLRLDFIQRTLMAANVERSILSRSVAGTVQFAAPEQICLHNNSRIKSVGTYSDVYGFGKTLCYALFLHAQPNRRDWDKLEDTQFADLLSDCIAQDPSERPQDFDAVLKRLQIETEAVINPVTPEPSLIRESKPKPTPELPPEFESTGIGMVIVPAILLIMFCILVVLKK